MDTIGVTGLGKQFFEVGRAAGGQGRPGVHSLLVERSVAGHYFEVA